MMFSISVSPSTIRYRPGVPCPGAVALLFREGINEPVSAKSGEPQHPDKILSLFEPRSVVIRKGKAHKPNEFGRLVRIDEVENGLVSNYAVARGNLCDQQQWVPALQAHVELFGRVPRLAAADRGFWNSANENWLP
jgi:hypothetical protein